MGAVILWVFVKRVIFIVCILYTNIHCRRNPTQWIIRYKNILNIALCQHFGQTGTTGITAHSWYLPPESFRKSTNKVCVSVYMMIPGLSRLPGLSVVLCEIILCHSRTYGIISRLQTTTSKRLQTLLNTTMFCLHLLLLPILAATSAELEPSSTEPRCQNREFTINSSGATIYIIEWRQKHAHVSVYWYMSFYVFATIWWCVFCGPYIVFVWYFHFTIYKSPAYNTWYCKIFKFSKLWDLLLKYRIVLKFEMCVGCSAADTPLKFWNDRTILKRSHSNETYQSYGKTPRRILKWSHFLCICFTITCKDPVILEIHYNIIFLIYSRTWRD